MSRFVAGTEHKYKVAPPPPAPPSDNLVLQATYNAHPSFLAQPLSGRVVRAAKLYDNKIFIGYGDYSGNTGPIDVAYFDLATLTMGTAWEDAPTEEINKFRVIDGSLFVPWIDSTVPMPYLGYSTNHGGSWHNVDDGTMGALHIFDVASRTGDADTDIYMCGARVINNEGRAVILRSINNGVTWSIAYMDPDPGSFARFYGLHKFGNTLIAVGSPDIVIYDGISWSPWAGSEFYVGSAQSFETQGLLVATGGWYNGSIASRHEDPTDSTKILSGGLSDVVLDDLGRIWATYSNSLYIGTVDSSGIHWTRKGHLWWDTYMSAKIIPVAATGTLYVIGGDGKVRTANLPSHP